MRLIFEWDRWKAASNLRKHKVSFEEARTIFRDERLFTFPDEENSGYEKRLISIGLSDALKILLVIHTENEPDGDPMVIRMIRARKATASEIEIYEEG